MRTKNIKTMKKKKRRNWKTSKPKRKLTIEQARELVDSQIPPLTKGNQMIPQKIRWQRRGKRFSRKIISTSELKEKLDRDQDGKDQEYVLAENELLSTLRDERKELIKGSVPDESPYHLSFPWLEMREDIYWRLNGQEIKLFRDRYFYDLSYEQIAKREGLSVRQVRNKYRKLAENAFGPYLAELLEKKIGTRREAELWARFMSRKFKGKKRDKIISEILSARGFKP